MNPAPKVVMLVDNQVDGDSRVQKSARYMAELGWDVTLVGRSPDGQVREEPLGEATLLRVPTSLPLSRRRTVAPRWSWRHPMAYRDDTRAAAADALAAWRRVDLQTRLAGGGGRSALPARVVGKAQRVLHRTRSRQLKAAQRDAGRVRTRAGLRWRSARRQWAFDDPFLADLEVAFAPVLARLKPDLVHAHDFRTIGIAARYKQRAGGKPVLVYDAHEFLPGVGIDDARKRRGDEAYERVHLPLVDGTVCVAPLTGQELVKLHGLRRDPLVVLNAPMARSGSWTDDAPDVRSAAGVPEGTPLVVYVGVAAAKRGIGTVAAALPQLEGVHLVLVTKRNAFVKTLEEQARRDGCAERLHVLPYVDPDDVSSFVRTADLGVSVMVGDHLNHQLSLPTKIFEYAQGRIPVITSDVRASRELVAEAGIGVSFPAGDVDAFAQAVRTVLGDRERYTRPYAETDLLERWTWEAQCTPVDVLYRELLGRGPSPAARLVKQVEQALEQGEAPATDDVTQAARALLAGADAALDAGDVKQAAAQAARAQAVLFHRTLHFDQQGSPLAEDPGSFLEPWRASRVAHRLAERRSPTGPERRRPTSVAIVSYKNMTFVPPLERTLDGLGIRHHRVDLAEVAPGAVPLSPLQQMGARLRPAPAGTWAEALEEALGDADAVWLEWGQRGAVAASMLPLRSRRVLLRLHSFEAFTVFPHLVDWSAVDDLVFVGPQIRDLLVPQLIGLDPATTRSHVVPNSVRAGDWARPKDEDAPRTLAVVGWGAPAKDVVWALDLLGRLRAEDPSYRMLLVGHAPPEDGPVGVRAYAEAARERLARPDVTGAVTHVPFTPDVAGVLAGVGVLVSSSVREAHPMAVVEGAASGAVPVVRDWPLLASYDGPRRLFPQEWVVDDLDAAVERVLETTRTRGSFAGASRSAAQEAAARFDDSTVERALATVLDGDTIP